MKIMRWISTLPLRMRTLFLKEHLEQELDEELQFHLDRRVEQLVEQGLSPQEARQQQPGPSAGWSGRRSAAAMCAQASGWAHWRRMRSLAGGS
jgi:hypothetical protein